MKKIIALLTILFSVSITGCGGGLNGNWTCHTQGQNGAVTLNLECRSDGTVVFNGSNFGATWSGNHTILVPLVEDNMNESAQLLRMMADAVVNENGTVIDEKELATIDAKNKLKKLAFRIPVKWIDSDHIDLGGVKKEQFSLPAFGFTRAK